VVRDAISDEKLSLLSKRTDIPVFRFKEVLGIPPENECQASSVAEASNIACDTPLNSEEECAALAKWCKLIVLELVTASTFAELQTAYYHAPGDTAAFYLALEKWENFSLNRAESAQTFEEALEVYRNTPSSPKGYAADTIVLKKMLKFVDE
jgi:hypothetical protein